MKKCIVLIVVLSVPCSLVFVVGCQPGEYKDPATGEVIPKEQFNQLPPADQEKYEPTTPDPLDGAEGVMAVLSPFAAFEPITGFIVGAGSVGIPLLRKVRKLVPEAKAAWERAGSGAEVQWGKLKPELHRLVAQDAFARAETSVKWPLYRYPRNTFGNRIKKDNTQKSPRNSRS